MNHTGNFQNVQVLLRRIGQEWWGVEPGVLPVPFIAHGADQAAVAVFSMVLCYYGRQSLDQGLMDEMPSALWGEWDLPHHLVSAARACGMDAAVTAGNVNRLMDWLQQGVPVLVFPEGEIRGEGDSVAVVTGLTRDRTAVCLHYGANPHLWLQMPDFLALCGGDTFTAVPVAERHQATHARTRNRVSRPGQDKSWLNILPTPVSAMAA